MIDARSTRCMPCLFLWATGSDAQLNVATGFGKEGVQGQEVVLIAPVRSGLQ
jgi:hypothetical protein